MDEHPKDTTLRGSNEIYHFRYFINYIYHAGSNAFKKL